MKKNLLILLSTGILLALPTLYAQAQDKKPVTISITITEDDEVTTDTTIELKNGHDAEMIKKIVTHMTGEDIDMEHFMSMSHSKVEMIHADEDMVWHNKEGGDFEFHFDDLGIDLDSIKEAHGGQKIMVMKDGEGSFTVKELGEGDDDMILHKDNSNGKHKTVTIIMDDDEEGDHIIKSQDHHIMIMSDEEDDDGKEKTINVFVTTDENSEGEEENVEVYVIKNGDKDIKVIEKKIKVKVEVDDEDIVDIEENADVQKKVKKKRK
jgi:hypothetical protein